MAVYNGERYLKEQLESFALQTRLPDELIVCDDMSNDGTLELLEAFKLQAPFDVKIVVNRANMGYTRNFEKAISLCTGNIIFLSDQDDIWFPNKIEICVGHLAKDKNVLLCIHDANLVDDNLIFHGATKMTQVARVSGKSGLFATGALTVIRQDILRYVLPIPEGIVGHDIWIHQVAKLLGVRSVVPASLQVLRRHSSNTSVSLASSVTKIKRKTVLWSGLRTVAAKSYDDRGQVNSALAERITHIAQLGIGEIDAAILKKAQANLYRERLAIESRNSVVKSRRLFRRLSLILKMLRRGQYEYFEGWKSCVRDAIGRSR